MQLARSRLPGDVSVWRWGLVGLLVIAVLLGFNLLTPRRFLTGTNSTGARQLVVVVDVGRRLCIPLQEVPAGTAAIELQVARTLPGPGVSATRLTVDLSHGPGPPAHGQATAVVAATARPVDVPLSPLNAAALATAPATAAALAPTPSARLCLATRDAPVALGGQNGVESGSPPTVDGRILGATSISVGFRPVAGARRSLWNAWPAIVARMSLFRPAFARPAVYWFIYLVMLPLIGLAAIALLAVAGRAGRRVVWGLAAIALLSSASWALTTVPFDAPDESEHFAYVEVLSEAGRAPDSSPGPRAGYAGDETRALVALHHFATIEHPETRPPWSASAEAQWRAGVAAAHPRRDDGGAYQGATAGHSPAYYALMIPAYRAARSAGVFAELFWMRLSSALLSVVVVLCAFAVVRELAPSRPREAVAAGLLVAFEPIFGFISGAVNNDVGVNAVAALVVWQLVRALRRGLTLRAGVALGVSAALLPLMKVSGLELAPAALLAMALIAWRQRGRSSLLPVAAALGALVVVTLGWATLAGGLHRSVVAASSGQLSASLGGLDQLVGHLTYLWELLFPRLPGMGVHWGQGWPFYQIYIRRGFGGFGWYAIYFPVWVYRVVLVVMALCAGGALLTAWRSRRVVRERWREGAVLALVVLGVLGGVEWAYYSPGPRASLAEQGRYALPAAVALAALAVAGVLGLSRRRASALITLLVCAAFGLSVAGRLLYITASYT